MSPSNLLLDTCVILFALEGATLRAEAVTKIREAGKADSLFVSPASAWEIGKLVAANKLRLPIEPLAYFEGFASAQGVSILIATARINNYTIVTRDRAILNYGQQGHVKTLAC
jgi:PIN domain nuclease of toxin-antitoxin system